MPVVGVVCVFLGGCVAVLLVVCESTVVAKVSTVETSILYFAAPGTAVHTKVGVSLAVLPEVGLVRVVTGYCLVKVAAGL